MMAEIDMPVRQAGTKDFWFLSTIYNVKMNSISRLLFIGAIYLKNMITQYWADKPAEPGLPLQFSLHEQDRSMIRDSIVDAIVHAPELIQYVFVNHLSSIVLPLIMI